MKIFQINKTDYIVCETKDTQNGFKHEANLLRNGYSIYKTNFCFINQTWECFEYETILLKVINDNYNGTENQKAKEAIKERC